jgi:hypothetical protein
VNAAVLVVVVGALWLGLLALLFYLLSAMERTERRAAQWDARAPRGSARG